MTQSFDVALSRSDVWSTRQRLTARIHVQHNKVEAHFTCVVENDFSDSDLVKQLGGQKDKRDKNNEIYSFSYDEIIIFLTTLTSHEVEHQTQLWNSN